VYRGVDIQIQFRTFAERLPLRGYNGTSQGAAGVYLHQRRYQGFSL
jgi:hypothetical protein